MEWLEFGNQLAYAVIPVIVAFALIPLIFNGWKILKAKALESETKVDDKVVELAEKYFVKFKAKLDTDKDGEAEVWEVQAFIEEKSKGRIKGKLAESLAKSIVSKVK